MHKTYNFEGDDMTKRKVTLDDIREFDIRLQGYYGICIDFPGYGFDLKIMEKFRDILNEIINDVPRKEFDYETDEE
jgi:hypothetical protein